MATATKVPIATTTLGSGQSSVTFSNISGSYTDLVLIITAKNTSQSGDGIGLRVGNGSVDSNSNYSWTRIYGNGTAVTSDRASNGNTGNIGVTNTTAPSVNIVQFQNYSNTSTYKPILTRVSSVNNSVNAQVNLWRSTSAINQIYVYQLNSDFTSGSTLTLYGIL